MRWSLSISLAILLAVSCAAQEKKLEPEKKPDEQKKGEPQKELKPDKDRD